MIRQNKWASLSTIFKTLPLEIFDIKNMNLETLQNIQDITNFMTLAKRLKIHQLQYRRVVNSSLNTNFS